MEPVCTPQVSGFLFLFFPACSDLWNQHLPCWWCVPEGRDDDSDHGWHTFWEKWSRHWGNAHKGIKGSLVLYLLNCPPSTRANHCFFLGAASSSYSYPVGVRCQEATKFFSIRWSFYSSYPPSTVRPRWTASCGRPRTGAYVFCSLLEPGTGKQALS